MTAYDGGVTVACPGSNPIDVPNGTNGESCTVAGIDGGVQVSCPGSSPVTVTSGTNGQNGAPGLGLSNGLKLQVISVSNTSPVAVRFKVMDERGNPVDLSGKYSINSVFVPRFSLSYHELTNGIVGAYKVFTKTGSATAASATDPAVPPANVVLTPTTLTPTWPIPAAGVPATDAQLKGLLVENGAGFGDYTYTFPTGGNTQLKNSSNRFVTSVTAPVEYDASKLGLTHTVWIQASRQTDLSDPNNLKTFSVVDFEYNYVPNGAVTPVRREVASQAGCNKCHNGFKRDVNPNETIPTPSGFHGGGRVEVAFCNVCHNPDRVTNPSANSSVFVHRIHAGHLLTANPDGGVPPNAFHGLEATYPQDNRNCAACHAGAAQGGQYLTVMNRQVCGSCHDNVDFTGTSTAPGCDEAGNGPAAKDAEGRFLPCTHPAQADDTACAVCHGPQSTKSIARVHLVVVPPDPLAGQLLPDGGFGSPTGGAFNNNTHASWMAGAGVIPQGATAITYDLKEVRKNSAGKPEAVFKLKATTDAGTVDVDFGTYVPVTNTELIPGFVGSPSVYFAWSQPQDGIASPADFNVSASCYVKNAWNGSAATGASACSIVRDSATGYYTVTMTNITLPASAGMLTGGLGYTYGIQTTRPLTQVNLAAYPYNAATGIGGLSVPAPNVSKVATGFTARRQVVDNSRCNTCHAQLGVGPSFHAGQRNDAQTCTFCHTPNRTSSGWSANSKDFIHSIHGARVRTVAFNWHALSENENYGEVEFPSNTNNCQACHLPGTYDYTSQATVSALPRMLMSTAGQGFYNRVAASNPTGWYSLPPQNYVQANAVDYGFGYSTSNVSLTLPNGRTGSTQAAGTVVCSDGAPCVCTAANPCEQVVSGPVIYQGVSVNVTQKVGSVTNACNSATPCTCTTAAPCSGTVATCSVAAPCEAQGTTLVKSPITAACSACHDAAPSIAHMETMGGSFYDPRSQAMGKVEQCLICHGPGTIAPITDMHK